MVNKILIVDDEFDYLLLLARNLQRAGYLVWTATNAAQAIQLAHYHRPDVVLMDIVMPGLDGQTAMKRIKQELSPSPLIFMVSGKHGTSDMQESRQNGADDYIRKPFSAHELTSRLSHALKAAQRDATPLHA